MPELWGGSADLAGSTMTSIEGGGSFLPQESKVADADPFGRIIHFGVREHAMGAILNGIALSGLTRPFGGTFLTFSDYMRGAVRLSAIMQTPVVYVWTHDSIGLGEDGPTHQPVEHLWSLRAMPRLRGRAARRCGGDRARLGRGAPPRRARRPVPDPAEHRRARPRDQRHRGGVARGAYVLAEADGGSPAVILLATGSEVGIAVGRARPPAGGGHRDPARLRALPGVVRRAGSGATAQQILPPSVRARVSVEAGATLGWWKYLGDGGEAVGLDHFGASADGAALYQEFGITAEAVARAAKRALDRTALATG